MLCQKKWGTGALMWASSSCASSELQVESLPIFLN